MTTLDPPNPPATDGRRARGERTRAAIISAFIQLITEGERKPTGAQIAGKAGTSIRALWANFADLESLYEATGRVLLARQDERTVDIPVELALHERIDRFCTQRAMTLEDIAPFARASRIREPFSAALRHNRRRFIDRAVANIEQVFAPELAEAGSGGPDLLLAIAASTSWSWWSLLRDDFELDVPRCTEIMRNTLSRMLARPAAA